MKASMVDHAPICQIGIIVRDVDKTAEKWSALLGIEPALTIDSRVHDLDTWVFRGKKIGAVAKIVIFRPENIELEFIQPIDGDGTWREFLETKGEGIHHIAFTVKDLKGKLEQMDKAGYPAINYGDMVGGRFAYCDGTEEGLATIIELLEFDEK